MWRVIGCRAVVTLPILDAPTVARAAPPSGVDTPDAIVCQLPAGCPSSDAAARPSPADRPPGGHIPHARRFSFREVSDDGEEASARPAATGRYDLRIGFMFGSARFTPDDRARAAALALALRDPRIADRRIRIEGHADPVDGAAANLDLSRRRARAVGETLAAAGVDRARLDLEGYCVSRPLPGRPADAGADRRVIAALAH